MLSLIRVLVYNVLYVFQGYYLHACPCGYSGDPVKDCDCTPIQINRYVSQISGPLLDRIDIHVEVPRVAFEQLQDGGQEEPSSAIKARVEQTRAIQRVRLEGDLNGPVQEEYQSCNAMMTPGQIKAYCILTPQASNLLKSAFMRLGLTARGHHRVLKVARTIADLEGSELIDTGHLAEAIQYRKSSR